MSDGFGSLANLFLARVSAVVFDVGSTERYITDSVHNYHATAYGSVWEAARDAVFHSLYLGASWALVLLPTAAFLFLSRLILIHCLRMQGVGCHVRTEIACKDAFAECKWIDGRDCTEYRICAYCKGYPTFKSKKSVEIIAPAIRCREHIFRPAYVSLAVPELLLRNVSNAARRFADSRAKDPVTDVQLAISSLELNRDNLTEPGLAAHSACEMATHIGLMAALCGWVLDPTSSLGHDVHSGTDVLWRHLREFIAYDKTDDERGFAQSVAHAIFDHLTLHEYWYGALLFASDRLCDPGRLLRRSWSFAKSHRIVSVLLGAYICGPVLYATCILFGVAGLTCVVALVQMRWLLRACILVVCGHVTRVLFGWVGGDSQALHERGLWCIADACRDRVRGSVWIREFSAGISGPFLNTNGWVVLRCATYAFRIAHGAFGDPIGWVCDAERHAGGPGWRPRHGLLSGSRLMDVLTHEEICRIANPQTVAALETPEYERFVLVCTSVPSGLCRHFLGVVRWCWFPGRRQGAVVDGGQIQATTGTSHGDLGRPLLPSGPHVGLGQTAFFHAQGQAGPEDVDLELGAARHGTSAGQGQTAQALTTAAGVGTHQGGSALDDASAVRNGGADPAGARLDRQEENQATSPSAPRGADRRQEVLRVLRHVYSIAAGNAGLGAMGTSGHNENQNTTTTHCASGAVSTQGNVQVFDMAANDLENDGVVEGPNVHADDAVALYDIDDALYVHDFEDVMAWPWRRPDEWESWKFKGTANMWHDGRACFITYRKLTIDPACRCLECAVRRKYDKEMARCQEVMMQEVDDIAMDEDLLEFFKERPDAGDTTPVVPPPAPPPSDPPDDGHKSDDDDDDRNEVVDGRAMGAEILAICLGKTVDHTTGTVAAAGTTADDGGTQMGEKRDVVKHEPPGLEKGAVRKLARPIAKAGKMTDEDLDRLTGEYKVLVEEYKKMSFQEKLAQDPTLRDELLELIEAQRIKECDAKHTIDAAELKALRYRYGEKVLGYCLGSPHLKKLFDTLASQKNPYTTVMYANREIKADKRYREHMRNEARALMDARLLDDEAALEYCGVPFQGRALLPTLRSKVHIADGLSQHNEMAAACSRHFCRVEAQPLSMHRRAKIVHVAKQFSQWVARHSAGVDPTLIREMLPAAWTEERINNAITKAVDVGVIARTKAGKFFVKNNEVLQKQKPRGISSVDDHIVIGHALFMLQVESAIFCKYAGSKEDAPMSTYFLDRSIKKASHTQLSSRFADHILRISNHTAARRGLDKPTRDEVPLCQSIDFGSWDSRVRAHLRECESIIYSELFWCLEKRSDAELTALFHRMAERLCLQGNFITVGTSDYGRQSGDRGTSTLNAVINLILDFVLEWEMLACSTNPEVKKKYRLAPGVKGGWNLEQQMKKRTESCEWDFCQEGDDNTRFISADFLDNHVRRPCDTLPAASKYFHKCCLRFYGSLGMLWEPATRGGRVAADGPECLMSALERIEFCSRHQVAILGVSGDIDTVRCVSFPKIEKALTSAAITFSKHSLRAVAMSTFGALAASAAHQPVLHEFALAARHFYAMHYSDPDDLTNPGFLALTWASKNLVQEATLAGCSVDEYIVELRNVAIASDSDAAVREYTEREYGGLTLEKQLSLEDSFRSYQSSEFDDAETAWEVFSALYLELATAIGL